MDRREEQFTWPAKVEIIQLNWRTRASERIRLSKLVDFPIGSEWESKMPFKANKPNVEFMFLK